MNFVKNVGLFLASPFIGLAYVVALPWVFLYQVVTLSVEKSLNIPLVAEEEDEKWTS